MQAGDERECPPCYQRHSHTEGREALPVHLHSPLLLHSLHHPWHQKLGFQGQVFHLHQLLNLEKEDFFIIFFKRLIFFNVENIKVMAWYKRASACSLNVSRVLTIESMVSFCHLGKICVLSCFRPMLFHSIQNIFIIQNNNTLWESKWVILPV